MTNPEGRTTQMFRRFVWLRTGLGTWDFWKISLLDSQVDLVLVGGLKQFWLRAARFLGFFVSRFTDNLWQLKPPIMDSMAGSCRLGFTSRKSNGNAWNLWICFFGVAGITFRTGYSVLQRVRQTLHLHRFASQSAVAVDEKVRLEPVFAAFGFGSGAKTRCQRFGIYILGGFILYWTFQLGMMFPKMSGRAVAVASHRRASLGHNSCRGSRRIREKIPTSSWATRPGRRNSKHVELRKCTCFFNDVGTLW